MPAYFEIHEADDGDAVRLRLKGELDVGSAPVLEQRLRQLRADKRPVWLDLGGLEFMDASGIRVLVEACSEHTAGCRVVAGAALSLQVKRLFRLAGVESLFARPGIDGHSGNGGGRAFPAAGGASGGQ